LRQLEAGRTIRVAGERPFERAGSLPQRRLVEHCRRSRQLVHDPAQRLARRGRARGIGAKPAFGERRCDSLHRFGPPGLPPAITVRLNTAIVKALHSSEVTAKMQAAGLLVVANTPEQFAQQQRADYDSRGKLIKALGVQPE
jgi:hypothetical protein